jgi:hypothetical protein
MLREIDEEAEQEHKGVFQLTWLGGLT